MDKTKSGAALPMKKGEVFSYHDTMKLVAQRGRNGNVEIIEPAYEMKVAECKNMGDWERQLDKKAEGLDHCTDGTYTNEIAARIAGSKKNVVNKTINRKLQALVEKARQIAKSVVNKKIVCAAVVAAAAITGIAAHPHNPTKAPPGWYADKHPLMRAWENHERWDLYEERAKLYVEFRDNNTAKILGEQMQRLNECRDKLAEALDERNDFDSTFYQQKIIKLKDTLCTDYERLVVDRGGEVRLSQTEIAEIRRIRAENAAKKAQKEAEAPQKAQSQKQSKKQSRQSGGMEM